MKNFDLLSFLTASILFICGPVHSATLDGLTYEQAAQLLTAESLNSAYQAVAKLQSDSAPHETKDVRKVILTSREMLDLFNYAFEDGQQFKKLRKLLDEGYELVGHYKDLYDLQKVEDPTQAQYDKKVLKKRLTNVLEWKKKFFLQRRNFESFLKNTSSSLKNQRMYLSKQFWGATTHIPDPTSSAIDVLKSLKKDLWQKAAQEYQVVRQMQDIGVNHADIETYHDFRKRIRATLKLVHYFPELANQISLTSLETLNELVSRYGDVSDLMAAVELRQSKRKSIGKLEVQIKDLWLEIQEWEIVNNVESILNCQASEFEQAHCR